MNAKWLSLVLLLVAVAAFPQPVQAQPSQGGASVETGCWLVSIEKVDLASNTYKLDFYLWFRFDPSEISADNVKAFEFLNGAPSKDLITESEGYIEYRIRGDFFKTFNFAGYPFETHTLSVELEHKNLNSSFLTFVADPDSAIDNDVNVAGWTVSNFGTGVDNHSYASEEFSRFTISVSLARPVLSSFIKSVLPISIITTIALLAFFISPQNFAQRIGLGVTTLLSATAFHLSLLSGIPPTGYLTFADRMMVSIYAIFLYNLSVSVYIMRLVDKKKTEEAEKVNKKALRFLPVLIALIIVMLVVTQYLIRWLF